MVLLMCEFLDYRLFNFFFFLQSFDDVLAVTRCTVGLCSILCEMHDCVNDLEGARVGASEAA